MSDNLFVIDSTTNEGSGSKNIVIYGEADFIQECEITKYELSADKLYIQAEVVNKQGKTSNARYYLPKAKESYETEDKYKTAVRIFLGNMANIARKFKGEDYKVEGKDALDVAEKVIAAITPMLKGKKLFVLFELTENSKGIFSRIGSFSPFANNAKDLIISQKQKDLLEKRKNGTTKPDAETNFTPSKTDDLLPF